MAKHLNGHAGGNGKPRRNSDCDQILELVLKHFGWDLWHWEDEASVSFKVSGRQETHKLSSSSVKRRVRYAFRERFGRAPNNTALTDAIAMLEAMAFAEGWERPIHVRVAEHKGVLFIDLGGKSWRIVRIDMHGWKVIERRMRRWFSCVQKAFGRCPSQDLVAALRVF